MTKTCYYELLGIERDATADEIKSAYRKQALKWHPDKNGNTEEATQRFQAINEANSTLSDPNERAWYDSHREQILSGKENDEDYCGNINLWPYFTNDCFKGFEDDEEGFWAVYQGVFVQIDRDEEMEEEVGTTHYAAPLFGNSKSTAEEVFAFYSHWNNFATIKSFAWSEKYNPNEGNNRRIRRLIEGENKKERQKSRKAFNDLVKALVDHIKKRDTRYSTFMEEKRREKQRKLIEAKEKEEERKRKRKEEMELFRREQEKRWAEEEAARAELGESEDEDSDEEEEPEPQEVYCEACKKLFKNENQWENHQKSKKHQEKIERILQEVLLEEERAELQKNESEALDAEEESDDDDEEEKEEDQEQTQKKGKHHKKSQPAKKLSKKEKKKLRENQAKFKDFHAVSTNSVPDEEDDKNQDKPASSSDEEEKREENKESNSGSGSDSDSDAEDFTLPTKFGQNRQAGGGFFHGGLHHSSSSEDESEEDEEQKEGESNAVVSDKDNSKSSASSDTEEKEENEEEKTEIKEKEELPAKVETSKEEETTNKKKRRNKTKKNENIPQTIQETTKPDDNDNFSDEDGDKKKGKKGRRAKKEDREAKTMEESLTCGTCKDVFTSRNALFKHIKQTGHGVLISAGGKKGKRK